MIGRIGVISGLAIVSALGLSASAQADTVVGQSAPTGGCSGDGYGQVQISTGGGASYTIPSDGTITSFSAAYAGPGSHTKLLILQPVSGTTFNVVAKSDFGIFTTPGVQTFPTNIPVKAGQVIGEYGNVCAITTGTLLGDDLGYFSGTEPATGANQAFSNPAPTQSRIDLSANLAPPAPPASPAPAKKKCKKKKKHKHSAQSTKKKCKKKKKK